MNPGDITIKKLVPERVDDFFRFFEEIAFAEHDEWGRECYCCFFHAESEQQWKDLDAAENRILARQMIESGTMLGLLAYAGDVPVGWCHYDWKDNLPGLHVFCPVVVPADEAACGQRPGAIVCFTIAQGYRGQGIASLLLEAACQDLAALGCRLAEAYPPKNDKSDEVNYHGPLAMYLSHGFTVEREAGQQMVVRRILAGGEEC